MPVGRLNFIRATLLFLLAGVLLLTAIVTASLWLSAQTQSYFAQVVGARELRSAAADLMSLVQDAETGQRGYLLTGDPTYLFPYRSAVDRFEIVYGGLVAANANNAASTASLTVLSGVLRSKFDELKNTIELVQSGRRDEAMEIVSIGSGKALMDQVRTLLGIVIERSETELRASIAAQEMAAMRLRWVLIAGALSILLVVGGSVWIIVAYTRELAAASREVAQLNVGLEERVKTRTQDLERANEEIQRFAYIVTHDLRAPLVNIMGFTSELETAIKPLDALLQLDPANVDPKVTEARLAVKEDLPEAIGFIKSSTRKMDALINAILKISREGRRVLRPEPVDLSASVDAAVAAVHHQATENGGDIAVDVKAPRIVTDRLSLDQILGNLLDNAIKYRASDRVLRIVVRARQEKRGRVAISVEDNGRGIAAADTERIFELFRRAGPQTVAGEGIGLAHVRALARNLGGDIVVSSILNAGSTFTLTLPIHHS